MFVKIKGETHYLWRAVDQEGTIIDCYVTKRRNKRAALGFLRKAIKNHGHPRQIITDKLASYRAALKDLSLVHLQETQRYQNNQVENSHLHFRRREKMMNRFRSMRSLEQFASIQSQFQNHFNYQRHIETRTYFKQLRQQSLDSWNAILAT